MAAEYTIISIGTLSRNLLWGESAHVRTAHATTTLISDGKRRILVDPSLPGQILEARFNERTGGTLADVTDVFCTTLRPVHRRGLDVLRQANWSCHQAELEAYGRHLAGLLESAERLASEDAEGVRADIEIIRRFRPAPERFGEQIHLYPLAGPSVGSAGLLLTPPANTIVIAGDAAVTAEHFRRGQVWRGCVDTAAAMAALRDLVEIADVIVPGHDNVMLTVRNWL
jgi:glyoxylase-like metal-dependent hydrolase (beta-lactamase superfamily II)